MHAWDWQLNDTFLLFFCSNVLKNFTTKILKFSDKKSDIFFLYFCSKHSLWVVLQLLKWVMMGSKLYRFVFVTAYLEVKIWSLPKHENLTTDKKYCGKEEKLLLKEQFLLFSTIFSNTSLTSRVPIAYIFVKCGCANNFFPQFCKSDMSRYGYLEVFQRVPWNSR